MKSIFSILLITLSTISNGMEAIIIEHNQKNFEAQLAIKILTEKFSFPKILIKEMITKDDCLGRKNSILHICIDSNGDFLITHINQFILQNNFKNFIEMNHEGKNENENK